MKPHKAEHLRALGQAKLANEMTPDELDGVAGGIKTYTLANSLKVKLPVYVYIPRHKVPPIPDPEPGW